MNSIRGLVALAGAILAFVTAPASAQTWHRADTHHFTIYSDGSASQLEDFAVELEKFDALLRLLWRRPQLAEPTKLTIYMVANKSQVEALSGRDNIAGFYRTSLDGSFAVSNRERTRDKTELSGQSTLFHEYAHHFMFANFQIPAPAWFVEGFAEFVATAEFKKNGDFYFGKPAFHRAAEIEYFSRIPVTELLTKRQHEIDDGRRGAYYGWAWALTHMLYMDEEKKGERVANYVNLLNRGEDSLSAARKAFGDLDTLDKQLRDYVNGRMSYSKSARPLAYIDSITVTRLSDEESAVVQLTMERRSPGKADEALEDLRELTAGGAQTADAWYQLARAEFSEARDIAEDSDEAQDPDYARALAASERALAINADHPKANILKARILMEQLDAEGATDPAEWDKVRSLIITANNANPRSSAALYYYAETFNRQGKRDDTASAALATAFEFAPEAREIRVAHAFDLANNKRFDEAINLLKILANDPHGGSFGQRAIAQIEAMQKGGIAIVRPRIQVEVDDGEEDD